MAARGHASEKAELSGVPGVEATGSEIPPGLRRGAHSPSGAWVCPFLKGSLFKFLFLSKVYIKIKGISQDPLPKRKKEKEKRIPCPNTSLLTVLADFPPLFTSLSVNNGLPFLILSFQRRFVLCTEEDECLTLPPPHFLCPYPPDIAGSPLDRRSGFTVL